MQSICKGDEPLICGTGFSKGVELGLGRLNLVPCGFFGIRRCGRDADISTDPDQVAANSQFIDGAGIVRGVGGGRRPINQIRQIADPPKFFEGGIAAELLSQQDRFGQLPLADMGFDDRIEALMERLVEVP